MEVEEQGRPARRRARRAERELYGNPDRAVHCQDILGTQPLAALMYVLSNLVFRPRRRARDLRTQ